jgi:hypothetical protein
MWTNTRASQLGLRWPAYAPHVNAAVVPLLVVAVIVAASVWVYLSTPVAWLLACVLLWVFFFPMYVVSRSR